MMMMLLMMIMRRRRRKRRRRRRRMRRIRRGRGGRGGRAGPRTLLEVFRSWGVLDQLCIGGSGLRSPELSRTAAWGSK
eukprot:2560291-Pyramimonas_sp.AAC.1